MGLVIRQLKILRTSGKKDMTVNLHILLANSSDGDEWSASCSGRLIPRKEPPVAVRQETAWLQFRSECGGEENNVFRCWGSNTNLPEDDNLLKCCAMYSR
jgi:hypothetical protein